ncbi:polysaccharide biosynthesis tyrosine autokinase [Vibrio methylphosphonaticus]|uniref:polysaccharide biosynthesis tyrosine autokinase n=1 Tax=Vibrio methylphosphonaticus TaxID=2946866 RepID=UPI002029C1A8|nr:polysaccharide biosynthesis tyrosine autokinase [Vibrio methylphosphonaticus]MCL9775458.1 polysaccharide biosynthesis tyrosine autokinase [Vibrio methylphosphonaticus]
MQNQNTPQMSTSSSDEIDLGKLFGILLDAKWLIIVTTFVFTCFGIAFALLSTPIYKADALIQVEQKSGGMSSLLSDGLGDMFAQESSATTEIELIKSRMVLGQTVDKLNLTTVAQPKYLPKIGKGLARLMGEQAYIDVGRLDVSERWHYLDDKTLLLVQTDDNNQGFELRDAQENVLLTGKAGALAEGNGYRVFVTYLEGKQGQEYTLGKRARIDAIGSLQSALAISERGKQTGILQLSMEGEHKPIIERIVNDISQNYFLQNVARQSAEAEKSLEFLQGHLPDIKISLTAAEDTLNQFRQDNESIDLGLEAQSTLKVMVELEAQLNELTFKESEVSQRFTKDHPAYRSLLEKRETLLGERERLNKQIQKLPKTQREVLRMTRDVEVNQQIYVQLLNKVQELRIMKAGTVGNVRIIDSAQSHTNAVKPKKSMIVVLATLLGGMLSVAFVLVKAAFHKGVESPDEIEAIGLPVYASVPKSDMQLQLSQLAKRHKGKDKLLAESNPADLSIEALRGLRTSLHFAMMEAKNNILMISGPAPGIGKSFISTNFAAVAAKTGQKVLLVDADMRKGYLQKQFNLKWDDGLSELLSGKLTTDQVVKPTDIENLHVITRGQVPPNPSELLMHPRFQDFIEWSSENYDLVIIDTPPVLAVTDPSIVGALAGTTLMVARYGQNTLKEIEVAQGRFEQSGIEVKGVIFNAIEKKASSGYGYGYYNYAYTSDEK